jgi:uncharacterized protein YdbL (DUF1318 family)
MMKRYSMILMGGTKNSFFHLKLIVKMSFYLNFRAHKGSVLKTGTVFGTALICTACVAVGCAVSPPAIHLTGDRTLVENQIIGEYREIEPDAWTVSSVQTDVQRQKGLPAVSSDELLVNAMKVRELNEGAIREYKTEGVVGESFQGYCEYIQSEKYEKENAVKKRLLGIVEDENRARRVIFERSIVSTGVERPSGEEIAIFGQRFAKDEQSRALVNDWIQGSNGKWRQKK